MDPPNGVKMKIADRVFVVVVLAATVAVVYFFPRTPPPTPVVNVDAISLEELGGEIVEALSELPPYNRDQFGRIMGWPDNTGIEEGVFLEDCRDVCTAPLRFSSLRGDEELIRPRVLYADHEHLVCVCLRPHGNVMRYVGWEIRQL